MSDEQCDGQIRVGDTVTLSRNGYQPIRAELQVVSFPDTPDWITVHEIGMWIEEGYTITSVERPRGQRRMTAWAEWDKRVAGLRLVLAQHLVNEAI